MKRVAFGIAAGLVGLALPACGDTAAEAAWTLGAGASAEAPDAALWRAVDPENLFIFETTRGRILIEAFPGIAPKHFAQFTAVIRSGDLDGTTFHRVIDDFMAQGGDIWAKTGADPGWPGIPGEFTIRRDVVAMPLDAAIGPEDTAKFGYIKGFPILTQPSFFAEMSADGFVATSIPHCRGVVSTARTDDPNSGDTQFFLMREHSPHLDKNYTAWGRVIEGEDIVRSLKKGALPSGEVKDPDGLTSAKVAADLPETSRPKAWVLRTDTDAFAAELATRGEVDVCTLPSIPAIVK
ncbi:MAG: peptidylprolyl isomerase [Hyphomonas sp.]|uniref:peptidylprolyl isomerase n=1 Tax=Hyphomonas sp. TaxID=87 RepID=UPI0017A5FC3A|nr:peptidylprolyl isomerase [Hyphomonas sp.]MBA3067065.1 peptidylprolyl isomerase [Hyphomonas sp.]MBU3921322.1 peptidylprolyl isomerase [Alphaproteobacteria bacterium]MBU4063140.1 peptidylprolyl isomerase [Alphaproteobacteria bacterium]MBU4164457.1 peptidylprolyl isomerase [Alphaproteobacteria bacterium]